MHLFSFGKLFCDFNMYNTISCLDFSHVSFTLSLSCVCVYMCMCIACMGCGIDIFVSACVYCSSLHIGTYTNIHPPPTHTHTLLHVYIHTLRDAVRFCFGPMLQKELDEFREDWNNHRIRKSTMAETLGGIPEFLYFAPAHCGQLLQFCTVYTKSISEYVQVPKTIFVMLIGIYLSLQNYTMQNLLKVFA